jgi:hypothetical protein
VANGITRLHSLPGGADVPDELQGETPGNQPISHSPDTGLPGLPKCVADTGLDVGFLGDLICKHLHRGGVLTLKDLAGRLSLPGVVVEEALHFLRKEQRIEIRAGNNGSNQLRYALTERGRTSALDALLRSGYTGAAPVPVDDYRAVAKQQSIHLNGPKRHQVESAFADMVVPGGLLDVIGPSLNSGRAIFVYGPPGTGKTFITKKLGRLFGDAVLVPHALLVGDTVVQLYDPLIHKVRTETGVRDSLSLETGLDPRYVVCERPVVVSGGELTTDMLDIQYDPSTRLYQAPLQLKANNGIFILDDLGRQKVAPEQILNRWIVPMEERVDYLTVGTGQHFWVPFDVVLVFSTNLNPLHLADEAFLRRIGYKIHFDYLTPLEYEVIWKGACREQGIAFDPELLEYLLEHLYATTDTPLLPCHPRDLLGIAMDHARYTGSGTQPTPEQMRHAWQSYFVPMEQAVQGLS